MVELRLVDDTLVHLGPHKLTIAELQQTASSIPRPPVDYSHGYTEEMAEADIRRIATVVAMSELGEEHDLTEADVSEARPQAALILSKLHGWKLGAPPESPGHAYARLVHEEGR